MPNRGRSFILGYGDETDPDSVLQLIWPLKTFSISREPFGFLITERKSTFQSDGFDLDSERIIIFSIIHVRSINKLDGKTL